MHPPACFLVLLLISAQVDDYWAAAPVLRSAPLADDHEYLPLRQRTRAEECSPHHEPVFAALRPQTADLPLVRRGVPCAWDLTTPFSRPPLYVFMSLQI